MQRTKVAIHPVAADYSATIETSGDSPLSPDENWELIFSLFGSAKDLFAEFGGGEAFLQAERAAWNEVEPV